jgi:hypothetical protein
MDAEQREQIERRRHAIAALLAEDPEMSQRTIAKLVGTSQRTVSRDVEALRHESDSASRAAAQAASGRSAGQRYRQRMDDELARLSSAVGAELFWSAVEIETLSAVSAAMDRRAAILTAYASCADPLSQRGLDAAREARLIERQIVTMTTAIQDGLSKVLREHEIAQAKQHDQPESIRSRKARKAVNSRWRREALRQAALERRGAAEVS